MRSTRVPCALLAVSLLLLGAPRAGAEPPTRETYTKEELAALDHALEAANLDRASLAFRKDLAKGHACLDAVKAMLRDPLAIAPAIDAMVADARRVQAERHAPLGALVAAHDRLPHAAPLALPSNDTAEQGPVTPDDLVARLIVLRSAYTSSVALVTEAKKEIHEGDHFRTP